MKVFVELSDILAWRESLPPYQTMGLVPTMGALHAGHGALLKQSTKERDFTVLTIFVNPIQFGPKEDFAAYPRTLDSDLKLASELGVDAVWIPQASTLYPSDFSTQVIEKQISEPLCGKFRPGHFSGVATVVVKLLNAIRPTHAYFGLKDAQQYFVIQRVVRDLNIQTEVIGVETIRESSGLALSSRNQYLTPEDRTTRAPEIFRSLNRVRNLIEANHSNVLSLIQDETKKLNACGFDVQYFEFQSDPVKWLAIAAFIESGPDKRRVRLIDNLLF